MARPVKNTDEKRTERFNLRLTLAELERVQKKATAAGMGPHEYARGRVLEHKFKPRAGRFDSDVIYELNRIGVNVNQLARSQNAGREFRGDWRDLSDELRRVLDKVATLYG